MVNQSEIGHVLVERELEDFSGCQSVDLSICRLVNRLTCQLVFD
jgi:hypothetical protein